MSYAYITYINCTLCGRKMLNTEMRVLPSKRNPELPLGVCLVCFRRHTLHGHAEPVEDRTELLETLTKMQRLVVGCMPATAAEIIAAVWPNGTLNSSKSVAYTTISQLRRKLVDSRSCWRVVSRGKPAIYDVVRDE